MSVSVPNTFTANTKIQSAQVNANFTAVLALTPITTLGDLVYASSSTALARLAGNTATSRKFLGQTGDGVNSAAPAWGTPLFTELASTTLGDLPYATTAGAGARLAGNTTATVNFLGQTGTGSVSAAPAWTAFTAPTVQKFTSTGSTTGYLFVVSSANATVGATYTNNSNTYTVLATISGATQLFCSNASAPQASGTLTKAAGTGDATITFSTRYALGTYTTPTSPRLPLYLRIRAVGAGGGGSGSGVSGDGGAGNAGQPTAFGASLLICNGGSPGGNQSGGAGGSASLGSGPIGVSLGGAKGSAGMGESVNTVDPMPGFGGNSAFGGGGAPGIGTSAGTTGIANTGGGGSGGSSPALVNRTQGSGGGAGGFVDAIIASPAATYVYLVGGGGGGGTNGTSGQGGGSGADGLVLVEEFYQ